MDNIISVALPKGRLGEKAYKLFAEAGYVCDEISDKNTRKLVFTSNDGRVKYFWVKPSDVGIYVERGAADIGIVGSDILAEYQPDVYDFLDLGIGKCRMCVAGPKAYKPDSGKTTVVATKFPRIASDYYASKGQDIDIVKLCGSIELAPILNLSDVIVDIVETGTTLLENDLVPIEQIIPISARLIANKASYKFKSRETDEIVAKIAAITSAKGEVANENT